MPDADPDTILSKWMSCPPFLADDFLKKQSKHPGLTVPGPHEDRLGQREGLRKNDGSIDWNPGLRLEYPSTLSISSEALHKSIVHLAKKAGPTRAFTWQQGEATEGTPRPGVRFVGMAKLVYTARLWPPTKGNQQGIG